jgi:hypothetical protein
MSYNELMALDQAEAKKTPSSAQPRTQPRAPASAQKRESNKPNVPKSSPDQLPSPELVERLRKAVKTSGKEAATHRFTSREKARIAEVVYTYGRRGYRTCENEIVRVATNWLLEDYRAHGQGSVLHEVLRALKE